jgi:hypothetical protein
VNRRLTAALLPVALTAAYLQAEAKELPVKKIVIVGNRWTKKEFILREILLKVGQPFSPKLLKESVRNLLNTHLFYKVEAKTIREKGGVVVVIKVKEKFPIVPLPRFRLKTDGSYKAGLELRDYNLFGMGHKLFLGFTKWFNSKDESENQFVKLNLYRTVKGKGNLSLGFFRSSQNYELIKEQKKVGETRKTTLTVPAGLLYYLDPTKVHKLKLGVTAVRELYEEGLNDRSFYYLNLGYQVDRTTDMVYYTLGRSDRLNLSVSAPSLSYAFTGAVTARHYESYRLKGTTTVNWCLSAGSKFGYSGEGLYLKAPIEGYEGERVSVKRYLIGCLNYRRPVVDRSVYLSPTVYGGEAFNDRLQSPLLSVGVEVEAFWAKLADGIIRFKLFRGLGPGGTLKSSFRLTVRW